MGNGRNGPVLNSRNGGATTNAVYDNISSIRKSDGTYNWVDIARYLDNKYQIILNDDLNKRVATTFGYAVEFFENSQMAKDFPGLMEMAISSVRYKNSSKFGASMSKDGTLTLYNQYDKSSVTSRDKVMREWFLNSYANTAKEGVGNEYIFNTLNHELMHAAETLILMRKYNVNAYDATRLYEYRKNGYGQQILDKALDTTINQLNKDFSKVFNSKDVENEYWRIPDELSIKYRGVFPFTHIKINQTTNKPDAYTKQQFYKNVTDLGNADYDIRTTNWQSFLEFQMRDYAGTRVGTGGITQTPDTYWGLEKNALQHWESLAVAAEQVSRGYTGSMKYVSRNGKDYNAGISAFVQNIYDLVAKDWRKYVRRK